MEIFNLRFFSLVLCTVQIPAGDYYDLQHYNIRNGVEIMKYRKKEKETPKMWGSTWILMMY